MAMCMMIPEHVCGCDEFVFVDPEIGADKPNDQLTDWVRSRASDVLGRITQRNDGMYPTTVEQWIKCCERYEISVRSLRRGSTFTSVLVGTRGGAWWIFYNSMASPQRQARYIAHELGEYLMQEESWHVKMPSFSHGLCEYQIRHMIALCVEDMVSEGL
jgi:hypothetical protein